jgi:hypothetical protein
MIPLAGRVTTSVARDNSAYGIGARTFVAKESKAQTLDQTKLARIEDAYVRMSVRLQAAFGLRREEAIKFNPSYAIRGDHIALKSSWTQGGRARTIPITNGYQHVLLREAKALAKGGSLIPAHLKYVHRLEEIRQAMVYGIRPTRTFQQAAIKYLEENQYKKSLTRYIYAFNRADAAHRAPAAGSHSQRHARQVSAGPSRGRGRSRHDQQGVELHAAGAEPGSEGMATRKGHVVAGRSALDRDGARA